MGKKSQQVELPYRFEIRDYQLPLWHYMFQGGTRAFWCIHRRGGKDINCWNIMISKAMQRVGNYLYTLPTREQAIGIIWDGKTKDGRPFLDYIPQEMVQQKSQTEKKITLVNGSMIRLEGTDDIDRLMGQNPVGIVFSEYSLQKPEAWQFLSPILVENGGWAIFNGTARPPSESPHFYEMHQAAQESPDWFHALLTVDDTGAITAEQIQREVDAGIIKPHLVRQEYYNDFFASSEDILIPIDLLNGAIDRRVNMAHAVRVAGVDVGHSLGGDPSAIVIRQGGRLVHVAEKRLNRLADVATWVAETLVRHDCSKGAVDGIGWGAGLGALVSNIYPHIELIEVNVAEQAPNKSLHNRLRDSLWWSCREWFEKQLCCIPSGIELHRKLINELSGVTYRFLPVSNKVKIEGKEDMKKRMGGQSPNLADALCLTFSIPEGVHMGTVSLRKPQYLAA